MIRTTPANRFRAKYGIVDAARVPDILEQFRWAGVGWFAPHAASARDAIFAGVLKDFAVVLPLLNNQAAVRTTTGITVPVLKRVRRPAPRQGFPGSSPRQRGAIEGIAGALKPSVLVAVSAASLRAGPTQGHVVVSSSPSLRTQV